MITKASKILTGLLHQLSNLINYEDNFFVWNVSNITHLAEKFYNFELLLTAAIFTVDTEIVNKDDCR